MENILFFYILVLGLIITAVMTIFSRKIFYAVISAGIFFFLTAILYLTLNSILASIFQTVICVFLISGLIFAAYRQISEDESIEDNKLPLIKKSRLWIFLILGLAFVFLSGLLFYYFTELKTDELVLYSVEDIILSKWVSFVVVIKAVFVNYILAYGLVILSLFAGVTGAGILITKNKRGSNE